MAMQVKVNEDCTGCELCTDVCPEVFEMGDDGLAKVTKDPVPEGLEDSAQEAADGCPVDAIEVSQ
jgi:ferredoxin